MHAYYDYDIQRRLQMFPMFLLVGKLTKELTPKSESHIDLIMKPSSKYACDTNRLKDCARGNIQKKKKSNRPQIENIT